VARYHVICDCGAKRVVRGSDLRSGNSKSCGCGWIKYESPLDRAIGAKLRKARNSAREKGEKGKKGLEFALTFEQVKIVVTAPCVYCGRVPTLKETVEERIIKSGKNKGNSVKIYKYDLNSMDRINPDRGYTQSNVTTACVDCNMAKGKMPLDVFIALVSRIYNHYHGFKPILMKQSNLAA
jgi:hypothetical protein